MRRYTAADEAGEDLRARRILDEGNGADCQLRAHAAGGDARAVARDIAGVTRDI